MVYTVRQRCGQQLAIEAPTDADVVSTVPESATPAALGYAQQVSNNDAVHICLNALLVHVVPLQNFTLSLSQSGLPYVEVLCKNRYVGRTFIQPNTRLRQLGVAKKFGALTDNFAGKRVVLIDDSIVRGNTISPIIKLLKEAGATEVKTKIYLNQYRLWLLLSVFTNTVSLSQVHIRVASPPIQFPCYMGINIPTKEELIANKPEFEDIAGYIGKSGAEICLIAKVL